MMSLVSLLIAIASYLTWSISVPQHRQYLDPAVGSRVQSNQAHGLGLSSPFSAGMLFFIIFVSHNHTLGKSQPSQAGQ